MHVRLGATPPVAQPHRPGHPRQRRKDRPVHHRQHLPEILQPGIGRPFRSPLGQLLKHLRQKIRIEHSHRFGHRAQTHSPDAEGLLHLRKSGRPLEPAEARDRRIEEVEQQRCGVLVEVKETIAMSRAGAERIEKTAKAFEELEALQVPHPQGTLARSASSSRVRWIGIICFHGRNIANQQQDVKPKICRKPQACSKLWSPKTYVKGILSRIFHLRRHDQKTGRFHSQLGERTCVSPIQFPCRTVLGHKT